MTCGLHVQQAAIVICSLCFCVTKSMYVSVCLIVCVCVGDGVFVVQSGERVLLGPVEECWSDHVCDRQHCQVGNTRGEATVREVPPRDIRTGGE